MATKRIPNPQASVRFVHSPLDSAQLWLLSEDAPFGVQTGESRDTGLSVAGIQTLLAYGWHAGS